jgi:hypothetical protein
MSLDQIANIAEISAAVLVIVSLIYVGIQIQQNTDTLKLSTAHNTAEDFSAPYLIIAERGEIADIFLRGMQDIAALEPVERLRFYAYFHKFFRTYENAYYQFRRGALEAEPFEGLTQQLVMLTTLPGLQAYWQDRKFWYNKTFQEYVDNEIMTVEVNKDYKLAGT